MNNITDILQSIQQLNPDGLNQVENAIHERRQALSFHKVKDPEKLIAALLQR